MRSMTYAQWVDEFRPIQNHLSPETGIQFETYGPDNDFVVSRDPRKVWTEVDVDSGATVIIEGWHFVNRVCYYITRKSWNPDEQYEVTDNELELTN